jgi:hypothetical protein
MKWVWNLLVCISGDRFIVTKKLGIEDHRLISLQFFLRLCIAGYVVLWQICTMHQYATFEPVAAYGNLWDGELAKIYDIDAHCNNPQYNFGTDFTAEELATSGGVQAHNITCIPFSRQRHILVDSNSFTAVTLHTYSNRTVQYFFTDSPHKAVMNMIHGFTSSFLEQGVINPPTRFAKKSGVNIRSFYDKEIFGPISMADLLALAEVSLDSKNVQPWLRNGDPSKSPFYRLSGVVIVLKISYSNYRDYEFVGMPSTGKPMAVATAEALNTAWGFIGTSQIIDTQTKSPVSIIRTGIKVQMSFAGKVGRFNFMQLVLRLLEGVILLGMAVFGTEIIAQWLIYRGHYEKMTSERLHWSKLKNVMKLRTVAARMHNFSLARSAAAGVRLAEDEPGKTTAGIETHGISGDELLVEISRRAVPVGKKRESIKSSSGVEDFLDGQEKEQHPFK